MKREELARELERYLELNDEETLSRSKTEYLKLLDNLEKLGSERVGEYRTSKIFKLMMSGESWAKENPDAFVKACQINPVTGLRHCPQEWLDLNPEGFLDSCGYLHNSTHIEEAVKLWVEKEPSSFYQICHDYDNLWLLARGWNDTPQHRNLLVNLCEKDPYEGFEEVGDLWARVSPESFHQACLQEPISALRVKKSINAWKFIDEEGFWEKVEERIQQAISETKERRQQPGPRNAANFLTARSYMLAGDVGVNENLTGDLISVLKAERPDLLVAILPYLYNNLRGEAILVATNPMLWQRNDSARFLQACVQNPNEALLAVSQIGEEGRNDLKNLLAAQKELTGAGARLLGVLNGQVIDDHEILQDSLSGAQEQLRARIKQEVDDDQSQQAVLWTVEQGLKADMLKDTLDYLHIDDLLLDPTLVIRLCELTPEMPYLLYGRAINPLALGGGMGPWLARHLEALFKLIDLYQENPELLTPAILEGRDIDDSTEALLYLTLDDEQTLKLVTYGIQTPGVGEGTLAWATRRAGNLSEGGRKVKLARRNNNSDGMSVS